VATYRADLVVSYNNLGLVQSQDQKYGPSREAFQQALGIQQELVDRSRTIRTYSALSRRLQ